MPLNEEKIKRWLSFALENGVVSRGVYADLMEIDRCDIDNMIIEYVNCPACGAKLYKIIDINSSGLYMKYVCSENKTIVCLH